MPASVGLVDLFLVPICLAVLGCVVAAASLLASTSTEADAATPSVRPAPSGLFYELTDATFEKMVLDADGPVVVFASDRSPGTRATEKGLLEASEVTVYALDVDGPAAQDAAGRLSATQPLAVLVIDDDVIVGRHNGPADAGELRSFLAEHI